MLEKLRKNKGICIIGILMAAFFSGLNALGRYMETAGAEGLPGILKSFFLWLPVAALVILMLFFTLDKAQVWMENCSLEKKTASWFRDRKSFWIGWAVVFLLWLPAFAAAWPGIYVIDNVFQVRWFLEGNISAHHPILHTYLLGFCMETGKRLFDSYEIGLGFYSVGQMLILSGLFSYVIYALREKLPAILRILFLMFYGLLPFHAVSSFTATKDILFSGLFLIVILKSYELAREGAVFWTSWKKMGGYVAVIFLACCFRNTGIYIFICMVPFLFFLGRKYWKRAAALSLLPIFLWGIYSGPVYGALGITKGSSGEILSVPMQQMARAILEEGDKLEDGWKEEAEIYIPDYAAYASRVADPVKDTFNSQAFEEAPVKFLKLWGKIGLRCPVSYVKAFLEMNIGFWYPAMEYPDPGTYLAFIPYENADTEQVGELPGETVYIQRNSLLPGLENFYRDYTENGKYEEVPVLSWFYSPGVYFWILCFGTVYCLYKKRYQTILPWAAAWILWLTLMVSPVVVFRYAYPLAVSLPVMAAMIFGKYGKAEEEKIER